MNNPMQHTEDMTDKKRWFRSFEQYFTFFKWNLYLILCYLFNRRQHLGISLVRCLFI